MQFEKRFQHLGWTSVGVDEVGRGCLAGPVVAAAVYLPAEKFSAKQGDSELRRLHEKLNDSKLLTAEVRKELSEIIKKHALVQVAWAYPEEIDELNILQASLLAMRRAVFPFAGAAQAILVDGNQNPFKGDAHKHAGFQHVEMIVKGDQTSVSIASASVIAKVYRDEWMAALDSRFPKYGFANHKGYSTPEHQSALRAHGPCAIHRKSFEPVRLAQNSQSRFAW